MQMTQRLDVTQIPIIDIGVLGSERQAGVISAIRQACEQSGFFYITNHGIPQSEIDAIFSACENFFALPQAERDALYLVKSPNYRGYLPIGVLGANTERPRDLLESFQIGAEPGLADAQVQAGTPLHGANLWPANLPGFRDDLLRYFAFMEDLSRRLLRGFALAADLPADGFDHWFEAPLSQMRLLHYPAQEVFRDGMLGARAHRDFGFFTILLQGEVDGLEVGNEAGDWFVAPPIAGSFVVNVAEMLKLVSNGQFVSALHRVVNRSGRERYSVPFFVNPSFDAVLAPMTPFVDESHPAGFPPYHAGPETLDFYRRLWPSAAQSQSQSQSLSQSLSEW